MQIRTHLTRLRSALALAALASAMTLAQPIVVFAQNGDAEQNALGGQDDALSSIFGKGGVNLKADGSLIFESDPETGELKLMHVTKNVVLESDQLDLKCDDLRVNMVTQIMIAKGHPVIFELEGISGACVRFTREMKGGKMILEGEPGGARPFIKQKDADGWITTTRANKITVIQTENSNTVLYDGFPEITRTQEVKPKAKKKSDKNEKKDPGKINGSADLGKIPKPARAPQSSK